VGFGAFKIGRNVGVKYPSGYDLPDDDAVSRLLNGLLDLGINLIDTAPAYGLSEERIGAAIAHRRDEYILSTKVGERFEDGHSMHDFSPPAVRQSVQTSLRRLRTDVIDVLLVHSDGRDGEVLATPGLVETLRDLKDAGLVRWIGFSGKTVDGAVLAMAWADVIMATFHVDDRSHEELIAKAAEADVGVLVKKGLASGHLDAERAIRFVLSNPHVASMVIGGLSLEHIESNLAVASSIEPVSR
jgi:aryl-alcohol dehydrogenase-like predicted oxidoreductase